MEKENIFDKQLIGYTEYAQDMEEKAYRYRKYIYELNDFKLVWKLNSSEFNEILEKYNLKIINKSLSGMSWNTEQDILNPINLYVEIKSVSEEINDDLQKDLKKLTMLKCKLSSKLSDRNLNRITIIKDCQLEL